MKRPNQIGFGLFEFNYFNSLYFEVAISAIPIIKTIVWLVWKDPKKVQAAEPRAKTKPIKNCVGFGFSISFFLHFLFIVIMFQSYD
jgi:hypothetical protein